MEITFDPAKNKANIAKHGLSLKEAVDFEWDTAITEIDERFDYGEDRFFSLGYIGNRLHVMIFTMRREKLRVISLRKATPRERRRYEQNY